MCVTVVCRRSSFRSRVYLALTLYLLYLCSCSRIVYCICRYVTVVSASYGTTWNSTLYATLIPFQAVSTLVPDPATCSCRRRILCDFEKELTFRPKLNDNSLRLASKSTRSSLPLVHRLSSVSEGRKKSVYQEDLTFVPKLNALSLKLAQERSSRMPEVCMWYQECFAVLISS